ncbi:MAG: alkylation response protein AidB-like acyl-CoA dehydrogenase, partial [Ilumatobacter sp.]
MIGRWQFASGVDHGDWLLIGAIADELRENDFPGLRLIVAKSDIEVDDTWYTLVLRGSGSKMLLLMACSCHHIGRCRVALSSTVLANMVRHTAL